MYALALLVALSVVAEPYTGDGLKEDAPNTAPVFTADVSLGLLVSMLENVGTLLRLNDAVLFDDGTNWKALISDAATPGVLVDEGALPADVFIPKLPSQLPKTLMNKTPNHPPKAKLLLDTFAIPVLVFASPVFALPALVLLVMSASPLCATKLMLLVIV